MSDWRLLKTESFIHPPDKAAELAKKIANLPHSPTERELDHKRVKRLTDIVSNGLALPFNWATVDYGGQIYRMNGMHSSRALLELLPNLPEKLCFHLDHYKAESREGMVELFRQFDQRFSGRSTLDISGAYQGLIPEIADCDRKTCKLAADGISWYLRLIVGANVPSGDQVYDVLHNPVYTPFIRWVDRLLSVKTPELRRKEVVASMLATFEQSQDGSQKFWSGVALGPDHFTDDSNPGAVLSKELIDAKEGRNGDGWKPADYYKKCIKAWNAFCAGDHIRSLNVSKKGWPEVSPYTGIAA